MKCCQCDRPAFYAIGEKTDIPLCLHCYAVWKHSQDVDFLKNAMMMNHAMDQMDMVTGIHTPGGRLPVQALAKAMQKGHTLNNFQITQSQIGVLNTGSIEKIDAAITLSSGSDAQLAGETIKEFTEAILTSQEIEVGIRNELLELTETLAEEVVGKRKPTTISAVLKEITEKVAGVAALSGAATKLWEVLEPFLSS